MKKGFMQTAYDRFTAGEKSATLKAQGGNYGGGSETLVIQEREHDPIHDENPLWVCGGVKVH